MLQKIQCHLNRLQNFAQTVISNFLESGALENWKQNVIL